MELNASRRTVEGVKLLISDSGRELTAQKEANYGWEIGITTLHCI